MMTRNLLVLLVMFVLSIPAAEGVFRGLGDRPSQDLQGLFKPFDEGSYRLAPATDAEATWAAGRFSVHTDNLGLRCDQRRQLAARAGENVDVLFLGDSQGFGHGVNFDDSLAGSVAMLAQREGYHVANASVGGHAAANQLALARWLAEERGLVASNYVLLMGPLMMHNVHSFTRATVGEDGRLYDHAQDTRMTIRQWTKTNLVIYGRLRDATRNVGIGSRPEGDPSAVLRLYGAGAAEAEVRRQVVGFLTEVQQFASRYGSTVQVVYVPLTVEVDAEAMRRRGEATGVTVDVDLPRRIGRSAASQLGIAFHDLRPVLDRLHSQGDPLRLKGDFHYNPAASRACGLSIWQHLKAYLHKSSGRAHLG
jgi:hypothetical protein